MATLHQVLLLISSSLQPLPDLLSTQLDFKLWVFLVQNHT